jgi:hypothetical protein
VVLTALHVVVLALGMVVLLGSCLELRAPAPLVGAIVMSGCGVFVAQLLHFEQMVAIAWAPLLLAATDAGVTGRVRRPWAITWIAITCALTVLAGHLQPAFMILAVSGAWALARSTRGREPARLASWTAGFASWASRFACWAVGIGLGIGLVGAQLVPTAELLRRSVRASGVTDAALSQPDFVLHLTRTFSVLVGDPVRQWLAPSLSPESTGYIGAAAAILLVVGLVSAWRGGTRRVLACVLLACVVVSLMLASGARNPLFRLAMTALPLLRLLRVPARWLLVADLCLAVLAAIGADALRRASLRLGLSRAVVLAAVVLVPAAELAVLARNAPYRSRSVTARDPLSGLEPVAFLRARPERALTFGGHVLDDAGYNLATLRPNVNALAGIRSLDGYDGGPAVTGRWATAMTALTGRPFDQDLTLRAQLEPKLAARLLYRFGVRYVLLDTAIFDHAVYAPGWLGPVAQQDALQVWENPQYLGDALVYRRAVSISPPRKGVPWDLGSAIRSAPADTALVEGAPVACETDCSPLAAGLSRPRPERLTARATGPGLLVITEQWDPGWHAEVDGRPARVEPVDGWAIGVRMPAGSHRIELGYRVQGLRAGTAISLLSALGIALLFRAGRKRYR